MLTAILNITGIIKVVKLITLTWHSKANKLTGTIFEKVLATEILIYHINSNANPIFGHLQGIFVPPQSSLPPQLQVLWGIKHGIVCC